MCRRLSAGGESREKGAMRTSITKARRCMVLLMKLRSLGAAAPALPLPLRTDTCAEKQGHKTTVSLSPYSPSARRRCSFFMSVRWCCWNALAAQHRHSGADTADQASRRTPGTAGRSLTGRVSASERKRVTSFLVITFIITHRALVAAQVGDGVAAGVQIGIKVRKTAWRQAIR